MANNAEDRELSFAGVVLFVDDEAILRRTAERFLKRTGMAVLTARDGVEAIELFRSRAPEIALVVLDLSMPRKGGLETCIELQRIKPDVPIVLASGYAEDEIRTRFPDSPVPDTLAAFVQKPYKLGELAELIRRLVADRATTSVQPRRADN